MIIVMLVLIAIAVYAACAALWISAKQLKDLCALYELISNKLSALAIQVAALPTEFTAARFHISPTLELPKLTRICLPSGHHALVRQDTEAYAEAAAAGRILEN